MAPKAEQRSGSKSGLPNPTDGLGTDLRVQVIFVAVVLLPPGELECFCMGRLWGMAGTAGTPLVACPGLQFALCALDPMVVLCLGALEVLCPMPAPGCCLLLGVPPLGEEMHRAPKAAMRSGSTSGLPDPIDIKGTDEIKVAIVVVALVP